MTQVLSAIRGKIPLKLLLPCLLLTFVTIVHILVMSSRTLSDYLKLKSIISLDFVIALSITKT